MGMLQLQVAAATEWLACRQEFPSRTRSTIKIILMDNLRITHCELCAAFTSRVAKVWPLDSRYRNLVGGQCLRC